jgi:hypothetical protein
MIHLYFGKNSNSNVMNKSEIKAERLLKRQLINLENNFLSLTLHIPLEKDVSYVFHFWFQRR